VFFGKILNGFSSCSGLVVTITGSGVARVPGAPGQEIFLRLLSTKTTEFEVKKRGNNLKKAKIVLF